MHRKVNRALATALLLTCCTLSTLVSGTFYNCVTINFNSPYNVEPSGGIIEFSECVFDSVTVNATSIFHDSPVLFTLNNGRVDSGTSNGISVLFPGAADANLSLPLHFKVANMDFGQDAALKFSGVLPKNSSLIIANNSFYLTTINTFVCNGNTITAILIGSSSAPFTLVYTQIEIINNLVVAIIVSSGLTVNYFAAISIPASSVSLSHYSALIVNNNSIRDSTVSISPSPMYLFYQYTQSSIESSTVTLHNHSSISIFGNKISNCASSTAYVVSLYVDAFVNGCSLTLSYQSGLSITNNTIQATTLSEGACSVLLVLVNKYYYGSNITLDHASSIALDDNTVVNLNGSVPSVFAVYVGIDRNDGIGLIRLSNESTFTINGNVIRNFRTSATDGICGSAYLSVNSQNNNTLALRSYSSIVINNNTLENILVWSVKFNSYAAYISIFSNAKDCTMILDHATFNMSYNKIKGNFGGNVAVATLTVKSNDGNFFLVAHKKSSIALNQNGIYGCIAVVDANTAFVASFSATSRGAITVTVSNRSVLEMIGNGAVNSSFSHISAVSTLVNSYTFNRLAFSHSSTMAISNNYVSGSAFRSGFVVYITFGSAITASLELDHSIFAVEANYVKQNNEADGSNVIIVMVGGDWQATLGNASTLAINNNVVETKYGTVTVVNLANLRNLQCSNSSIHVINNSVMASLHLGSATILTVSGVSLNLSNVSQLLVTNNTIFGSFDSKAALVGLDIINTKLLWNSSLVVSRNTLRATMSGIIPQLSLITANFIIQGVGGSMLIINENNVSTINISSSLSTGNCLASIQLTGTMNVSIFSVARNTVQSSCHTMVRISGDMSGFEVFDISANSFTFLADSSPINNTLLSFAGNLDPAKESMVRIEDNIIVPGYSQGHAGFQLLNTSSRINWTLTDISACGNTVAGELLACPQAYILPAPPSNIVFCASTQHLCGPIAPTVSLTVSHTATHYLSQISLSIINFQTASHSGTTQATSMSDSSQSLSISNNIAHTISTTQFSESSIPSDTSSCLRSESINQSTSTSIDGRRPSVTLLKTGSQTASATKITTHTHHVTRATITDKKATEPAPILPVAVPPATTATLSVVSSTLGGVTAAVDSQVIAAVGLVSCARKAGDDQDGDLRALSAVALDNTCEGVLLGNSIAIAVGTILSAVSVVVMRGVQVFSYNRAPIGPAPTLVTACAMARAPQLLLTLCTYFMSSNALCGLQIGGAGLVAFVFSIVVVVSFPVLTLLFGARRLLRVTYNLQPRILGSVGSFVFQSWALDPSIDSHKLFGSVFGSYRRLSCVWAPTAHMSFIAGLPMMVATESSGTCGPFFAVSSALFFLFSIIVVAARPRRTTLADVLHSLTLLVNGLVTANATTLLYNPDDGAPKSLLDKLGTAITVLTILRLVHSASAIILSYLMRRGVITGVCIESNDVDDPLEVELLPRELSTGNVEGLFVHSPDSRSMKRTVTKPLKQFLLCCGGYEQLAYSGLIWSIGAVMMAPEADLPLTLEAIVSPREIDGNAREVQILGGDDERLPILPLPSSRQDAIPPHLTLQTRPPEPVPEEFLSDEERFRRELARDYGRRQIEELLAAF